MPTIIQVRVPVGEPLDPTALEQEHGPLVITEIRPDGPDHDLFLLEGEPDA